MPVSLESGLRPVATPHATQAGLWPGLICRLPKPLLVIPMIVQWLWLALRHGSLSLPSAADPSIAVGGLVGESKKEYFDQIDPAGRRWLARTTSVVAGASAGDEARAAIGRNGLRLRLSSPGTPGQPISGIELT